MNLKTPAYASAEQAALRLIARAEQNTAGLFRKLAARKHSPSVITDVLARLVETRLLDDERYARLWLKGRLAYSNKGPRFLLASLQARGIERETAKAALNETLGADLEKNLIRRVLARKKLDMNEETTRRLLRYEGFTADIIAELREEG
ncbi:MAG: recombination regulator RecX [Treponema sp.]|jgi:regulatory protein|nr:recombination regulator RecX [Treponema sp.]